MLTYWNDPFGTFDWMDDLRRRMESVLGELDPARGTNYRQGFWPQVGGNFASGVRMSFRDTGSELLFVAEVPGVPQNKINVSLEGDSLTISGERTDDIPEGYKVHRRERAPFHFTRTISLPCRVEPEMAKAELKDGILTLRLAKAADAKPRQISVTAA